MSACQKSNQQETTPVDNVLMSSFSHIVYVDVQCQQLRQEKVDIIFTETEHAITCNNNSQHHFTAAAAAAAAAITVHYSALHNIIKQCKPSICVKENKIHAAKTFYFMSRRCELFNLETVKRNVSSCKPFKQAFKFKQKWQSSMMDKPILLLNILATAMVG